MNNKLQTAIRCFQENVSLFGNAQTEPEKFNLYNGLSNLAEGVGDLEDAIYRLIQEIQSLRSQLKNP